MFRASTRRFRKAPLAPGTICGTDLEPGDETPGSPRECDPPHGLRSGAAGFRGTMIVGAMDSEAVEPTGAAAERVVGETGVRAAQLASVLRRTAVTLERSAALADAHAERYEQAKRSNDAAQERRVAGRAREAARQARWHAEEWLELAAERRPRPVDRDLVSGRTTPSYSAGVSGQSEHS